MIHWIESEDDLGFGTWLRYVEFSHWGLFFTEQQTRWLPPPMPKFTQPS
jgi:hypothetical protein